MLEKGGQAKRNSLHSAIAVPGRALGAAAREISGIVQCKLGLAVNLDAAKPVDAIES